MRTEGAEFTNGESAGIEALRQEKRRNFQGIFELVHVYHETHGLNPSEQSGFREGYTLSHIPEFDDLLQFAEHHLNPGKYGTPEEKAERVQHLLGGLWREELNEEEKVELTEYYVDWATVHENPEAGLPPVHH